MVLCICQLINSTPRTARASATGLIAGEMITAQDTRLLKLRENTVNRCQSNILVIDHQMPIHIFSAQMSLVARTLGLKQL